MRLIFGKSLRWILTNDSNIVAAPADRQYSNDISEYTWSNLIQMDRAFITEKQVGREFWYLEVWHAAMILNQVPDRLVLKLTTPFELVHNIKP